MGVLEVKYKQTEVGIIPSDWEVKKLGELGEFKNGINKGEEDFGFGFPFVNLMDVFGINKIMNGTLRGLVNSSNIERKTYELKKGDVLFIRSSVKPSGVGLTALVFNDLNNTVYSGFLIRFRDSGLIDFEYKAHCFYEEGFRKRLIDISTVSANTNINQNALKRLKIPLPPTKIEQNTIANVLSDADDYINHIEKLIAKKRLIKQGAMQKLLTPKEGWGIKKLGEIGECIIGLTYKPQNVKEDGILVLRSSNIQNNSLEYEDNVFVDIQVPEKLINLENDICNYSPTPKLGYFSFYFQIG